MGYPPVEHLTFNQRVLGSSPSALTTQLSQVPEGLTGDAAGWHLTRGLRRTGFGVTCGVTNRWQ